MSPDGMRRPYQNFDKEVKDLIHSIWKETPDLRVVSDFLKGLLVEIVSSPKHPDRIGIKGIATSCGFLEGELYVAVNFADPAHDNYQKSLSQIFFLPEVRFLRQK